VQYSPICSPYPIWGRFTVQNVSHLCPVYHNYEFFFLQRSTYVYHFVVPILFGTFNRSTATSAEVELSQSLQTAFANFIKNPNSSPAPHWPPYSTYTPTLAKIAYRGNVEFGNFVEPVQPDSTVSTRSDDAKFSLFIYEFLVHTKQDGPCNVWDRFLDFRP
jgi:hypothetical protein